MTTPRNENKIVKITPTSNGESKDWRNLLDDLISNIMKNNSPEGYIVSSTQNYRVPSAVYLTLNDTDGLPQFKSNNEYKSVIDEALNTLNNFGTVGQTAATGYKAIRNIVGGAINVGNAFLTDTERNNTVITDNSNISATFNPWFENVPAWTGGNTGRSFDYTFNFTMGQFGLWDAKEEVVNPILNLMAPTLQRMITSWSVVSPYPNQYQMIKEIFSDIFASIKDTSSAGTGFFDKIGESILNYYNSFTYTVQFGNMYTFYNMMIENSEISFSTETDDKGNPISGSIKLYFTNIIPSALSYKNGAKSFTINK